MMEKPLGKREGRIILKLILDKWFVKT